MDLFLNNLKSALADAVPVKVNKLFFTALYSPSVQYPTTESLQQYVVRREQDFRRMLEAFSPDSGASSVRRQRVQLGEDQPCHVDSASESQKN